MSATNRGVDRIEHDAYFTPPWCVARLLDDVTLPAGRWLDPCAGDGSIISAAAPVPRGVRWHAVERQERYRAPLLRLTSAVWICDFFEWQFAPGAFDVILTNPPYATAQAFIEKSLKVAKVVAMLLRLNFLGSAQREDFFQAAGMPDVYVLPQRPTFSVDQYGRAGTDATEYAWMLWHSDGGQLGRVQRLGVTPAADIAAHRRLVIERSAEVIGG